MTGRNGIHRHLIAAGTAFLRWRDFDTGWVGGLFVLRTMRSRAWVGDMENTVGFDLRPSPWRRRVITPFCYSRRSPVSIFVRSCGREDSGNHHGGKPPSRSDKFANYPDNHGPRADGLRDVALP